MNEIQHGWGIFWWANGEIFEGEFLNGKYHGIGNIYFFCAFEYKFFQAFTIGQQELSIMENLAMEKFEDQESDSIKRVIYILANGKMEKIMEKELFIGRCLKQSLKEIF